MEAAWFGIGIGIQRSFTKYCYLLFRSCSKVWPEAPPQIKLGLTKIFLKALNREGLDFRMHESNVSRAKIKGGTLICPHTKCHEISHIF